MSSKDTTYGFGVNPKLTLNHFYVLIPSKNNEMVQIYERFNWDDSDEQTVGKTDILKLEISKHKWNKLSSDVAAEFNARLKKEKIKTGRFTLGGNPIERLLGKELMVLLWSIEDSDPAVIPTAIRNWKGLMPEERWWLYTMTNASTGQINDKKGWRIALRYALCENPIEEKSQITLFDMFEE
jgi:hypothetical protein